jgi:Leucine-rich repeat (LRR) protein
LSYNEITELIAEEFSPLVNLEILSLNNNEISQIDGMAFSGLDSLRDVDLGFNSITDLTVLFSNTPALERVFLDNNLIRRLNANVFENNPELWEIDLHNNNIRFIEDGVFNNLTNLRTLRLSGNNCVNEDFEIENGVSEILPQLVQCIPRSQIDLECQFVENDAWYSCYISDVDVEEDIPIVISGEHLPGRNDAEVQRVVILRSTLSHVPLELFDRFPNLQNLDVSGNHLPRINRLSNCERLQWFIASYNDIEVVDADTFADCVSLIHLFLSSNIINEFHSNGLTNLLELKLNNNNISEIDTETFGYLQNLEVLWLAQNRITQTYPIMLIALENLRVLLLGYNNITELFVYHLIKKTQKLPNFILILDSLKSSTHWSIWSNFHSTTTIFKESMPVHSTT